jgi:predicted Zn-dependent protease with MMP-like domain
MLKNGFLDKIAMSDNNEYEETGHMDKDPVMATDTEETSASAAAPGDLDTIREILFGQQTRHRDQQVSDLEQRIAARIERLEQLTQSAFERIGQSLDRLDARIDDHIRQRDSEFLVLVKDIEDVTELAGSLHQDAIEELRAVESAAAETSASLQAAMHEQVELLSAALQEQYNKLNHQKADRHSLAALLNGLATSLEINSSSKEV